MLEGFQLNYQDSILPELRMEPWVVCQNSGRSSSRSVKKQKNIKQVEFS